MDEPEKREPVTLCIDVYKENIQSDVSIDKLKLGFVVREDLQNKDLIGNNWPSKAYMSTLE